MQHLWFGKEAPSYHAERSRRAVGSGPLALGARWDDPLHRASALQARVFRVYRMLDVPSPGAPMAPRGWQLEAPDSFEPLWDEALRTWSFLLAHPKSSHRIFAIRHLPLLPRVAVGDLLVDMLDDRSRRVRESAFDALGGCGPFARPHLSSLVARRLWMPPYDRGRDKTTRSEWHALCRCVLRLAPDGREVVEQRLYQTDDAAVQLQELARWLSPYRTQGESPYRGLGRSKFCSVQESAQQAPSAMMKLMWQLEHPMLHLGLSMLIEMLPAEWSLPEEWYTLFDVYRALDATRPASPLMESTRQQQMRLVLQGLLHLWMVEGKLPLLQQWLLSPQNMLWRIHDEYGTLALLVFFGALCRVLGQSGEED